MILKATACHASPDSECVSWKQSLRFAIEYPAGSFESCTNCSDSIPRDDWTEARSTANRLRLWTLPWAERLLTTLQSLTRAAALSYKVVVGAHRRRWRGAYGRPRLEKSNASACSVAAQQCGQPDAGENAAALRGGFCGRRRLPQALGVTHRLCS